MFQTIAIVKPSGIERAGYPFTTFFGPRDGLLRMSLQFRHGVSSRHIELCVDRLEEQVRQQYPEIKHIFLEVDSVRERNAEVDGEAASPQKEIGLPPLSIGDQSS